MGPRTGSDRPCIEDTQLSIRRVILMYKSAFISVVLILTAFGAFAAGYDASNFSADGRKLQPVPTGHVPGKDNGHGKGTHNAGEDCGVCHRPNGKSPVVFTMSGTLYEDRESRKPLKGGEVVLQDINGNVISMTSNKAGNFWTFTPIASNPYAVASHGGMTDTLYYTDDQGVFHPADPNDTRSWQYKAWVKKGSQVRPMVTIGPIGGSTDPSSRMSCSMHHAPMGSRQALWVGGASTLSSYPHQVSFKKHVLPILMSRCAPCHVPGDTGTRLTTRSDIEGNPVTKIDHSGALDLTSYNGSSVTVSGVTWTKRGAKDMSLVYQGNPDSSPLLVKTKLQHPGIVIHGGGGFWTATDDDYKAIKRWIAQGANNN
jgi:hypothetical protein